MATMLISFSGTVQKGSGTASGNLKIQIPLIAEQFPEISACHPGTINVQLDVKDFRLAASDFITLPIPWRPDHTNPKCKGPEVFHFTRIYVQPEGEPRYCAWLYGPQQSPHRKKPGYIEIISPTKIPGIEVGKKIEIFITVKNPHGEE